MKLFNLGDELFAVRNLLKEVRSVLPVVVLEQLPLRTVTDTETEAVGWRIENRTRDVWVR